MTVRNEAPYCVEPLLPQELLNQEFLNKVATTSSKAQDLALDLARTARAIPDTLDDSEALTKLLYRLESTSIDLQLRLQAMEDAAIRLGAKRP